MLMKLVASSQFLGRVIGESVVKKANVPDPLKANYKPLIASLKDAHGVSTTTVKDLAQHVVSKQDCLTLIQYLKSEAARNIDYLQRAELIQQLWDKVRLFDILSHLH